MQLKDFINQVVISTKTKQRMLLCEITSPYFRTVTVEPNQEGHHTFYSWPTINGDAFKNGYLVFENPDLLRPFRAAYDTFCRSQEAYCEEYGYWMRKD